MPLTPLASSQSSLLGGTWRYGSSTDSVGQLHDERPSVVQVPVPEHVIFVFDPVHQVAGRASGFLHECQISPASAPAIRASSRHGSSLLPTFQLTTLII